MGNIQKILEAIRSANMVSVKMIWVSLSDVERELAREEIKNMKAHEIVRLQVGLDIFDKSLKREIFPYLENTDSEFPLCGFDSIESVDKMYSLYRESEDVKEAIIDMVNKMENREDFLDVLKKNNPHFYSDIVDSLRCGDGQLVEDSEKEDDLFDSDKQVLSKNSSSDLIFKNLNEKLEKCDSGAEIISEPEYIELKARTLIKYMKYLEENSEKEEFSISEEEMNFLLKQQADKMDDLQIY